jgi:aminomethyltransferase
MKTSPLHDAHKELDASFTEFGGWSMPVQYGPILDEVGTVRSGVGLFDLSHMGRLEIRGPDAIRLVDRVSTNFCRRMPEGSIRYSLLCQEDGGVIDDILQYREPEQVFLVVNASNTETDVAWLRRHAADLEVEVHDATEELAMVAVQGQRSLKVMEKVSEGCDLRDLGYYKFTFGTVCGIQDVRISRTGYTGEDGFEVYLPSATAERIWRGLLEAGSEFGLRPIGLGARDILRLEAGMPLYGHEIDLDHNPIEAGLGFAVSFHEQKGDYVGRSALARIRENPRRRLVGMTTSSPRIPRQGLSLFVGDEQVGTVCSGALSPTLSVKIATAYLHLGHDRPGTTVEIDFRGKRSSGTVQELPFFSRTRK